jgi:hypothetical protein
VSRYVRVGDRPPLTFVPLDVPCPTCKAPPGLRCSLLVWLEERVVIVAGRVRRQPAGLYRGHELRQPHASRRSRARAETERRLRARRR